jgi:4-carboxymuconolactone decarboxylase
MTISVHPGADDRDWGGRLPRNEAIDLDDDQRAARDEIVGRSARWAERSGFAPTDDQGGLIGPFNAFTLRPAPGRAFNQWVQTDQRGSSLSKTIREVVILTVGVAWQADYEIYAHVAVARTAGLSETVIAGLRSGETEGFAPDELAAHRFTDELVRTHRGVRRDLRRRAGGLRPRRGARHGPPHRHVPRDLGAAQRVRGPGAADPRLASPACRDARAGS